MLKTFNTLWELGYLKAIQTHRQTVLVLVKIFSIYSTHAVDAVKTVHMKRYFRSVWQSSTRFINSKQLFTFSASWPMRLAIIAYNPSVRLCKILLPSYSIITCRANDHMSRVYSWWSYIKPIVAFLANDIPVFVGYKSFIQNGLAATFANLILAVIWVESSLLI